MRRVRRNVFAAGLLAALLAALAGCALSPQVVRINPAIKTAPADGPATAARLELEVVDGRGNRVLGRRGGVYDETATISTAGDITEPVRRRLAAALEDMGYRVGAGTSRLRVTISELDYAVEKNKVTRTITVHASVDAVVHKDGKTYSGSYAITRHRKMLTAPDREENEQLINETLGAALQRLLQDGDLFALINA